MHRAGVAQLCGAHETVHAQAKFLPQVAIFRSDAVYKFLRREARGFRRPLDFLPVLVGAGKKHHVVAAHAFVARNRIGHDGGVCVAHVWPRVDVVNWRGQVELRHQFSCSLA